MSDSGDDGSEGVIGRKMVFCPKLQAFDVDELIQSCDDCNDFVLYCCSCSQSRPNLKKPCHHFRLVFTDGACIQNGHRAATSGIGMAYGKNGESQQAIPVTELMDQGQKRTSQRAELLAAFHGVQFLAEADRLGAPEIKRRKKTHGPRDSEKAWIVATDSEYVVKGMTEWLPAWKENNLRTNRNTKPANLDLFLQLDAALAAEEAKQDVRIGFWHIPRNYNTIADALAKEAAQLGDPA